MLEGQSNYTMDMEDLDPDDVFSNDNFEINFFGNFPFQDIPTLLEIYGLSELSDTFEDIPVDIENQENLPAIENVNNAAENINQELPPAIENINNVAEDINQELPPANDNFINIVNDMIRSFPPTFENFNNVAEDINQELPPTIANINNVAEDINHELPPENDNFINIVNDMIRSFPPTFENFNNVGENFPPIIENFNDVPENLNQMIVPALDNFINIVDNLLQNFPLTIQNSNHVAENTNQNLPPAIENFNNVNENLNQNLPMEIENVNNVYENLNHNLPPAIENFNNVNENINQNLMGNINNAAEIHHNLPPAMNGNYTVQMMTGIKLDRELSHVLTQPLTQEYKKENTISFKTAMSEKEDVASSYKLSSLTSEQPEKSTKKIKVLLPVRRNETVATQTEQLQEEIPQTKGGQTYPKIFSCFRSLNTFESMKKRASKKDKANPKKKIVDRLPYKTQAKSTVKKKYKNRTVRKCKYCSYTAHNDFAASSHYYRKHLRLLRYICKGCSCCFYTEHALRIHFNRKVNQLDGSHVKDDNFWCSLYNDAYKNCRAGECEVCNYIKIIVSAAYSELDNYALATYRFLSFLSRHHNFFKKTE